MRQMPRALLVEGCPTLAGDLAGSTLLRRQRTMRSFISRFRGVCRAFSATGAALVHEYNEHGVGVLGIGCADLTSAGGEVEALTETFMAPNVLKMPIYPLVASPLVYPGQTLEAKLRLPAQSNSVVLAALRLKVYGPGDELLTKDSKAIELCSRRRGSHRVDDPRCLRQPAHPIHRHPSPHRRGPLHPPSPAR